MTTTTGVNANELIELCNHPVSCIKQVMWKSNLESTVENKLNFWGGLIPIIAICFEDGRDSCLYVAASDTRLVAHLSHPDDYDVVAGLTKQLKEEDDEYEDDELVGFFDLDSVVSPIPDWNNLEITKASVVTTINAPEIIGFCLWVNLGTRLGVFVAPLPGVTLSFNDACDSILSQAETAQQKGLVQISTKEFSCKETPIQIETIDWFDWLSKVSPNTN